MRVRNFEPNTPMRRSAKSFSRLRNRTKVRATNNREMRKVSAQKTRISSLLPGRRKLGSKAFCETRIASKSRTAIASKIMARLRLDVFGVRVGAGCGTGVGAPARAPLHQAGTLKIHYRCTSPRRAVAGARPRWRLRFLRRDEKRGVRNDKAFWDDKTCYFLGPWLDLSSSRTAS